MCAAFVCLLVGLFICLLVALSLHWSVKDLDESGGSPFSRGLLRNLMVYWRPLLPVSTRRASFLNSEGPHGEIWWQPGEQTRHCCCLLVSICLSLLGDKRLLLSPYLCPSAKRLAVAAVSLSLSLYEETGHCCCLLVSVSLSLC